VANPHSREANLSNGVLGRIFGCWIRRSELQCVMSEFFEELQRRNAVAMAVILSAPQDFLLPRIVVLKLDNSTMLGRAIVARQIKAIE